MAKRKQPASASASASASSSASRKVTKGNKKKAAVAAPVEPSWSEEVLHFGKAYGWALYCSANYWNYHDDGGCWADTCEDQSQMEGNWLALYKPGKAMKEYEDGKYTVLFLRTHGAPPVTAALWNDLQPMIAWINRLYLESYNDLHRVTKGKWSDPIVEGTIEEIAKIVTPLRFDRTLRMSMMVRGWETNKCNDSWLPRRLAKWLGLYDGTDLAYEDLMNAEGAYLPHVRLDNGIPDEYYWFTEDAVAAEIIPPS